MASGRPFRSPHARQAVLGPHSLLTAAVKQGRPCATEFQDLEVDWVCSDFGRRERELELLAQWLVDFVEEPGKESAL